MKIIYALLFITTCLLPATAKAELSSAAIDNIGKFLVLDFMSVSESKVNKPLTRSFLVKETVEHITIDKQEIDSLHGLEKIRDKMKAGRYSRISIINEVSGKGCIVRDAYINEQNQVYWSDYSQSLLRYEKRPELGNTGVANIMDYEDVNSIVELIRNSKRGVMPQNWNPSKPEMEFYRASINAINTILINRP